MKVKKTLRALVAPILAVAFIACGCSSPVEKPPEPVGNHPSYTIDEEAVDKTFANNTEFAPNHIEQKANSPLKNKTIYWLGSSVTDGAASNKVSMAEYLAARTGCISVKEAVSGTTIFEDGNNMSYVYRMENRHKFDKSAKVDMFICQISTNDAKTQNIDKWGELTGDDVTDRAMFDTTTSLGGVEYIISYVQSTWHCPVYFYSGAYFGDEGTRSNTNPSGTNYGNFVDKVKEAVAKWNAKDGYTVEVIDLYNDAQFNALASDKYYSWCMNDAIHPRQAGYLQWWTPYFDEFLCSKV